MRRLTPLPPPHEACTPPMLYIPRILYIFILNKTRVARGQKHSSYYPESGSLLPPAGTHWSYMGGWRHSGAKWQKLGEKIVHSNDVAENLQKFSLWMGYQMKVVLGLGKIKSFFRKK